MENIKQNGTNKTEKRSSVMKYFKLNGFGHKTQNLAQNKAVKEI
jgi:hypothetical protein